MARCPEETEVDVSSFPVLQLAFVSELKTLDLWTGEELVWGDRKSCAVQYSQHWRSIQPGDSVVPFGISLLMIYFTNVGLTGKA
jgi:hypothetical protein